MSCRASSVGVVLREERGRWPTLKRTPSRTEDDIQNRQRRRTSNVNNLGGRLNPFSAAGKVNSASLPNNNVRKSRSIPSAPLVLAVAVVPVAVPPWTATATPASAMSPSIVRPRRLVSVPTTPAIVPLGLGVSLALPLTAPRPLAALVPHVVVEPIAVVRRPAFIVPARILVRPRWRTSAPAAVARGARSAGVV